MPGRAKRDHRLIKDGFIVELSGILVVCLLLLFLVSLLRSTFSRCVASFLFFWSLFVTVTLHSVSDGVRKFRHLFLFNDYIICTKRKITARYASLPCYSSSVVQRSLAWRLLFSIVCCLKWKWKDFYSPIAAALYRRLLSQMSRCSPLWFGVSLLPFIQAFAIDLFFPCSPLHFFLLLSLIRQWLPVNCSQTSVPLTAGYPWQFLHAGLLQSEPFSQILRKQLNIRLLYTHVFSS